MATSKKNLAKEAQNYQPRPIPQICSRCAHFESERKLPVWMASVNQEREESGSGPAYGEGNMQETNLRCGLGGFAVKKTATCDEFLGQEPT